MKVLVEKEFELWEKRWHIKHDTPVIGSCERRETLNRMVKRYKTPEQAKDAKQSLVNKYLSQRWKTRKERGFDTETISMYWENDDMSIWIEEKVVSEKPVRVLLERPFKLILA